MLTLKSYYAEITQNNNNITVSSWTSRTTPGSNSWTSVVYGNGVFVTVAFYGPGWVMRSPDGITWTTYEPGTNGYVSVTWGNGLFVAVGNNGLAAVATSSTDGITWTSRTPVSGISWQDVTYGNYGFVAVGTNAVMTSPDGITWTSRTSASGNSWVSVTWGNGLYVAVSTSGIGNRVMTSSDGITWTSRTSAADNSWNSVVWGNGLFVAVSSSGTSNRVMTSPNGITWTIRTSAADNEWRDITYANRLFVAVASSGTGNRVMTSPDGITWTIGTSAVDNGWYGVTYGNGLFVAVSITGTGNQVMTWQDNVNSPVLTYDTSTNFVTSSTNTLPVSIGNGSTGLANVFYDPSSNTLSSGYVTTASQINDAFTLASQEFGSTMKCNNVLIPNVGRLNATVALSASGTSAMYVTSVYATETVTVTGVTFYQVQQGAYTANNYNGVGLFKFIGATGYLQASSTNDGNIFKAISGTFVSKAFSSPTTLSPGAYTIALIYSNSTSSVNPQLGAMASTASYSNIASFNYTNGAKLSGSKTTQTSMPTLLAWSEITVTSPTNGYIWAVLY